MINKWTIILLLLIGFSNNIMAAEIKTSIVINATPKKIWQVLTDFSAYPFWNPFIKSITGNVKMGEKIKVEFEKMTFKPKVLKYTKNQEFEWLGHLLFSGLFDGKHRFLLIDNGDGTTTFQHSESFKGILVPLFKKKLNTEFKPQFEEMNMALKVLVELGDL